MKEILKELDELTAKLNERDEELRRSEELLSKFFEESGVPMAFFDVSQEKFIKVNEALSKAIEYSKEELLSYHVIHFLFNKDSMEDALKRIEYRKQNPDVTIPPTVVRYRKKSGDEIWLRWHFFKSSTPNIYHSIAIDVTHEVHLQARVEELEKELSILKK